MKLVIRSLVWGLVLTGLTMLVSYEYCQNGPGRGFPFAVYCPSCGGTFAAIGRSPGDTKCTQVIDLAKLLGDVALWGGIAAGVQVRLARRRSWCNYPGARLNGKAAW